MLQIYSFVKETIERGIKRILERKKRESGKVVNE